MRRSISIVLMILGIAYIICGLYLDSLVFINFTIDVENSKTLNITTEDARQYLIPAIELSSNFTIIKFDTNVKKLKKIVEDINDETYKYYNLVNRSDVSSPQCQSDNKNKIYLHKYYSEDQVNTYSDEHIASIMVYRNLKNVCTNEVEENKLEVYIYDLDKRRFLDFDDVKKRENITDDQINKLLNDDISFLNEINQNDYYKSDDIDNLKLYYDNMGHLSLVVHYKKNNTYSFMNLDNN